MITSATKRCHSRSVPAGLDPEGMRLLGEGLESHIGLLFNPDFVASETVATYPLAVRGTLRPLNADASAIIEILNTMQAGPSATAWPDQPTSVMVCRRSRSDPGVLQEQGRMTRGAEYVEMENSGHFSNTRQVAKSTTSPGLPDPYDRPEAELGGLVPRVPPPLTSRSRIVSR